MKMQLLSPQKQKELKSIHEMRVVLNVPPLKMGFLICLCCDKQFFSEDKKNQKICNKCRR